MIGLCFEINIYDTQEEVEILWETLRDNKALLVSLIEDQTDRYIINKIDYNI